MENGKKRESKRGRNARFGARTPRASQEMDFLLHSRPATRVREEYLSPHLELEPSPGIDVHSVVQRIRTRVLLDARRSTLGRLGEFAQARRQLGVCAVVAAIGQKLQLS